MGQELIQPEQIERAVLLIRGQRVMLDRDLAALYGVETKNLNKAVRRNLDRFPADFMFQLSWCEQKRTAVVSKGGQFVVSKTGRASKSGRFACSAWPLNAGRAHPTERTVREGLTSAPPNLSKQRTNPGLVRLACPCRFKLQSDISQGVWGTASPSSPQAFSQNGLSAFANYKA